MPIIGDTQLQPVNVLGSFVSGMEMGRSASAARQQEALNALKMQQAQQEMSDANALRGVLARGAPDDELLRTPGGAALLKQRGEARESMGKGIKAEAEGVAARMQHFRQNIPFNPTMASAWLQNAYSDPVVGLELAKMGTLEDAIAAIPQDPAGYLGWMEGVSNLADKYVERRLPTADTMLPYTQTLTPEVEAQKIRLAGAGAARSSTVIDARNIPEKAYGAVVGDFGGKRDIAAYNAAASASEALNKAYETQTLLASGQPSTGAFAELTNDVNRVKQVVTGRKDKSVSDTEVLDALLGSEVFSQIQALGIGARGLDTPAEREYLRKVIAGTITLDSVTLKRMTDMRVNVMERAIKRYNKRVESGELDRFFRDSGVPKQPISMPERPSTPAPAPTAAPAGATRKTKSGTEYSIK
jgi:hypothetical protein